MLKLVLPSYLMSLLPEAERPTAGARRTVSLRPGVWPSVVREIEERFPLLAARVVPNQTNLANGFVLVVNDEVVRKSDASLTLRAGDEIAIIVAVAGG